MSFAYECNKNNIYYDTKGGEFAWHKKGTLHYGKSFKLNYFTDNTNKLFVRSNYF